MTFAARFSLAPLAVVVAALWLGTAGCGSSVGDCIETFQFEGTVVREGWTRAECDDWCTTVNVGVHLSCYFSGAYAAAPTGPSARRDGDPAAQPRRAPDRR